MADDHKCNLHDDFMAAVRATICSEINTKLNHFAETQRDDQGKFLERVRSEFRETLRDHESRIRSLESDDSRVQDTRIANLESANAEIKQTLKGLENWRWYTLGAIAALLFVMSLVSGALKKLLGLI